MCGRGRAGGMERSVRACRRVARPFALATGLAGAFWGCGDSTGPEKPDLTGTWDATSAILTNIAQPSQSVDVVPLGLDFVMIVEADGSVEVRIDTDGDLEVETGSITLAADEVTLVLDGDMISGTYSLVGSTLTLDLRAGLTWDFEGDGTDIPSTLLLVLVRRA